MSKKITWPELKLPAINLWNCPRQEELNAIKTLKALARDYARYAIDAEKAIKEREFLYYLRSGRFPE
jgi:hypothetical protein